MEKEKDLFSGKTEAYAKHRPTYPKEVLEVLSDKYQFNSKMFVADIGSGTGILSRMFLENGNTVTCVDPSDEMLDKAREELKEFPNVQFVRGHAESTGLKDGSVNLIAAGQSFHWFKPDKAKVEFKRILRGPNVVAMIWNDREESINSFNAEYERICRKYSPKYHSTGSMSVSEEAISDFFGWSHDYYEFKNNQELDLDGIIGRYSSASYSIPKSDENYRSLVTEFTEAFSAFSSNNKVTLKYNTRMFVGHLK